MPGLGFVSLIYLFANLALTLLSLPYCQFRGNLGTRSSLSKGPWSSPQYSGFPYAFRTRVRVRRRPLGLSGLPVHSGALASEQGRVFSTGCCLGMEPACPSRPQTLAGTPCHQPRSPAGCCLWLPLPNSRPSCLLSVQPSRPFPPACFSGSFVLAHDGLRSFPGFTPAQTLCRPWRSHTCARDVCVSHPLSKTSGDFLVLPSECVWDLTTCCQAACLFLGLGCPQVLGLC